MVNAADAGAPEPVDFEHPTAHAAQSMQSSALVIKLQYAQPETDRLKRFEDIPISTPVVLVAAKLVTPVTTALISQFILQRVCANKK
jgi:hypothetical protein